MRDEEGMNSEGKHVGKKCRLQLYQYPKRHKFASGISEVSTYMYKRTSGVLNLCGSIFP